MRDVAWRDQAKEAPSPAVAFASVAQLYYDAPD
jgi:hypothetical protein